MKLIKFKDLDTDIVIYINPMHILFIRGTLDSEKVAHDHNTNIYYDDRSNPIMTSLTVDEVAEMINDEL